MLTYYYLDMEQRILKKGEGWRIGWNPSASKYQGLVGSETWAMELTLAELNDFCRLLQQLTETMSQMASELMDEEKIACEAETDLIWMEVAGYPHSYSLRLILNSDRRGEGNWEPEAVQGLTEATQKLTIF